MILKLDVHQETVEILASALNTLMGQLWTIDTLFSLTNLNSCTSLGRKSYNPTIPTIRGA